MYYHFLYRFLQPDNPFNKFGFESGWKFFMLKKSSINLTKNRKTKFFINQLTIHPIERSDILFNHQPNHQPKTRNAEHGTSKPIN